MATSSPAVTGPSPSAPGSPGYPTFWEKHKFNFLRALVLLVLLTVTILLSRHYYDNSDQLAASVSEVQGLKKENSILIAKLAAAPTQKLECIGATADEVKSAVAGLCVGKTTYLPAKPRVVALAPYVERAAPATPSAPLQAPSRIAKAPGGETCSVVTKDGRVLADFLDARNNPKGIVVKSGPECLRERDAFVADNNLHSIKRDVLERN